MSSQGPMSVAICLRLLFFLPEYGPGPTFFVPFSVLMYNE